MMQTPVLLAILITALPLAAFGGEFLYAACFRKLPVWSSKLSIAAILGSLGLSLWLFFSEGLLSGGISDPYTASWTWFRLGSGPSSFAVSFDVLVDNLTICMFCVVTIVSSLVHIYSVGYMKEEERYPRFFFYLSLFCFSMLGLVTTSNLAMLFVFWELVGVCSYFLIGFFFFKDSANDAGKKAFVVNRVGDAGFMVGIFLIVAVLSGYSEPLPRAQVVQGSDGSREVLLDGKRFSAKAGQPFQIHEKAGGALEVRRSWGGTDVLSFQRVWESVALLGPVPEGERGKTEAASTTGDRGPWGNKTGLLVLAGILVFMGCLSKSAQFPLHIWLPDAMEGPTPVSALIHAATMVAAGVYMVARMFPLMAGEGYLSGDYFASPALWVVAGVGSLTAIFAATIAIVQSDLKKGLAYSTCSQLGYMVTALGVGSMTAGLFHLMTHAFFKACLFLCAGSVIHAVHSQEMSDMGGLRKKMPVTHAAFLICCLAISGVPFFSGFLSKEAILGQAAAFGLFSGHSMSLGATVLAWLPFAICGFTALLTAFYMFRLLFLTFYGNPGDQKRFDHAHEAPASMARPLLILSFLAIVAGGIALPFFQDYTGVHWFPRAINDGRLVKGPMSLHATTPHARELFKSQQVLDTTLHAPAAGWNETVTAFFEDLHHVHVWLLVFSLLAVLGGVGGAWFFFMRRRGVDFVGPIAPLARYREVLQNLYYVDWFSSCRVVPTVKDVATLSWRLDKRAIDGVVHLVAWAGRALSWVSGRLDFRGVDGTVRGTCWLMLRFGNGIRRLVTGRIEDYVKFTVIGMGVLLLLLLLAM